MNEKFFVIHLYDGFLHKDGKHITSEFEMALKFKSFDDVDEYIKRNPLTTNDYIIQSFKLVTPK